jgi:3'-phosphoadenosine 5'-phosphosulfate (PAPS) 3'-phosphatase
MPRLPAYYGRGNSQTTLTPAEQAQVINLVRRAAQSEIMPRYRNLSNFEITAKSRDDDLVTQAELDAEAMITRGLLRLFPHAQVVGEEAIAKTQICATLCQIMNSPLLLIQLMALGIIPRVWLCLA